MVVFFLCLVNLFVSGLTHAQDSPAAAKQRIVTLAQALDLASRNNLDLATKYIFMEQADARVGQAHAAYYPKLSGTAVLSPIYSAKGNALNTENDIHKLGVWVQSSVTLVQPLYTWGKLSSYNTAASLGVEVAKAQLQQARDQLNYDVKELYFGAILAEQLRAFLEEGKHDVDEVLNKAKDDQKKKRPTIAKRDFFRLQLFAAEAEYRYQEAVKLSGLARHALSLMLGFDPDEETVPEETIITAIEGAPPKEDELIKVMAEHRPEFAQLTNGIAAKKALLDAEKTNKYPMLFAGGMLTFAYSNVRNGQQSAYAYDPYNRSSGGAGVGVQWSWDFATVLANEGLLKTEIDELEKKQTYAKAGFRMELKKVLADLEEARLRLTASQNAYQVGRHWLASESTGYSIGLTEIKDLIDAYLARAKTAKDYWEAAYRVNLSWAALSKVVGQEIHSGDRTTPKR